MTSSRAFALWPLPVLGSRILLAVSVSSALLAAALWRSMAVAPSLPAPAASARVSSHAQLPELPVAARGPISAVLGADEATYHASASGRGLRTVGGPQRLRGRFERTGVTLSSGAASVGLQLRAAGYASSLRRVGAVQPTARANRVTYAHDGLSEWYVNGPLGVEQGFSVSRTLQARSNGTFVLSLALSGHVHASVSDPQDVALSSAGGRWLRYGSLSATDAAGHRLPASLTLDDGAIVIGVDTAGARFPLTIDPLIEQEDRPAPSDEEGEGRFGFSVALSADGSTALIGAPRDGGSSAGAAWVFTRSGSTWEQQGPKLTAGEPSEGGDEEECIEEAAECGFGRSVALSADGDTALIGAPRANEQRGAAWVFTRSGSAWSQFGGRLTGGAEAKGNGSFGRSVALSADGETALVGSPQNGSDHGAAWAFTRSASSFDQLGAALTGAEEIGAGHFGRSVALSSDGSTALIGAPGDSGSAGAAWAFVRSGAGWTVQSGKLTGGAEEVGHGRLGVSVALSADGSTALLGARADAEGVGAAWVFARSGSTWAQQGSKLTGQGEIGPGRFGYSVALSGDGNTALVGAPGDSESRGAAWTFARSDAAWTQQSELQAGGGEGERNIFGTGVALAANAATAVIGGPRATHRLGAVWDYLSNPPAPPTITSIEPASGPSAGGTPVTIRGSGFLAGATVEIGNAAKSVNVLSETEITAVTAATAPGSVEVTVSDLNGTSTAGPSYTYLEPTSTPEGAAGTSSAGSGASGGTPTPSAGSGVLASTTVALPPPKLAVTGNLIRLTGVVRVKLPGSPVFTLLAAGEQVPFGSIVDARRGKVAVTTADAHGKTQTMTFYDGEFGLTQHRDGLVVSTLVGGDFSACTTGRKHAHRAQASASHSKHPTRKLWAEGHGKYSTKGNYATGAVLGTRWLTEDLCQGTLIRVLTDRVAVTNLVTHRHLTVDAGHSYLARAPGARGH